MHSSNRMIRPSGDRSQIVCRVCNQMFLSTQALIHHMDSHRIEHDIALRRFEQHVMFSQGGLLPNPFVRPINGPILPKDCLGPNYSLNPSLVGGNNIVSRSQEVLVSPKQQVKKVIPPFRPQVNGPPVVNIQQVVPQKKVEQGLSSDGTRPFLSVLEFNIAKFKEREIKFNSNQLDLTLKL